MGNQLSTDASCVTANRHTDPSNAGSKQRGIALAALTVPSSATDVGAAGTSAANLAPTNGALVLPGLELDAQQGPNPAVLVNQVAAKRRAQKWVHKLVKEAPTKMPGMFRLLAFIPSK